MTSQEVLGSPYDNTIASELSTNSLVAQAFVLSQSATVNAVYVSASGGIQVVTIYPDNGSGTGPNMSSPMGTGSFDTTLQYFYSGIVIPLSTKAAVQANTKYWMVFSSQNSSGIDIATYWTRPTDPSVPPGFEALISSSAGASWSAASSEVASAIFMVGVAAERTCGTGRVLIRSARLQGDNHVLAGSIRTTITIIERHQLLSLAGIQSLSLAGWFRRLPT